jgi:hypothetical protein
VRIRVVYTPSALYEWNIDGLSKSEILNVLHEMLMVSNVYKTAGKSDHLVANYLLIDWIYRSIKMMVG